VALAALAVLALGAISATAAQATEGPFVKVGGTRLAAGESKNIVAEATKEFKLVSGEFVIRCPKVHIIGKLNGSSGANGANALIVVLFHGCKLEGNGAGCELYAEPKAGEKELGAIRTVELESKLTYSNSTRTGLVLVLFHPKVGSVFVTLKFTGKGCTPFKETETTAVEGGVTGEAWSGGKGITVGAEPAETEKGEVNFPTKKLASDFFEKEGKLTEFKSKMTAFGKAATTFEGANSIAFENKEKWGVFTK
jgi:hypothetical protein